MRLPVKFRVNRTSFDRTSKRLHHDKTKSTGDRTLTASKSRHFLLMKLHLKSQVILASFHQVLASGYKSSPLCDKVFEFPRKLETCPPFYMASHQVLCREILPKIIQKYQEKRCKKGKTRKRPKNATKRAKLPHCCWRPWKSRVTRFPRNPIFWIIFSF